MTLHALSSIEPLDVSLPSFGFRLRRWLRRATTPGARDAALLERSDPEATPTPGLIPRLRSDHRGLLARYHRLLDLLASGDADAVPRELQLLRAKFEAHVAHENLRFYGEIEAKLEGRTDDLCRIRDFHREMDRIGRTLLAFVARYEASGITPSNLAAFEGELRQVGALLAQRIEREEADLYPLYEA